MFMCACCERRVARARPASTQSYRHTGRCQYCSGFPYAHDGSCLGMHGGALAHHLDQLVANGFWTRELARWWLAEDQRRLSRPAR